MTESFNSSDKDWRQKVDMLAIYNSEVARGLVHTTEWKIQMAVLQHQFDERRRNELSTLR